MNYTHLTQEERYQIYALLREGFSKHPIALRLERTPSTICREIKRNRNRKGYFAKHAYKLAKTRHSSNHKMLILLYGNRSKVILLCNGVLNRLLHILLSVCIQFTVIFLKIKLREVIYISIYVLGISARGGMDI